MIGEMKHRITIQKSVRTADGGGGFTESWQSIDATPVVYAAIMPLTGSEQLRYHQLEATATHRITIRHRTDVTPAMRIVKDATVYNITAVINKGDLGTYLEILAQARIPT